MVGSLRLITWLTRTATAQSPR
ncbi:hypothetical protein E2C01_072544 [Portunus trituberculatus]|uniref:Uncharacterized protein n=1 Tax=Portunus trituberculatus TaxID=210409 RepID=A0A5B7I847_PORTR|nr:hypothetical protein [Portunus trituberculatus]